MHFNFLQKKIMTIINFWQKNYDYQFLAKKYKYI